MRAAVIPEVQQGSSYLSFPELAKVQTWAIILGVVRHKATCSGYLNILVEHRATGMLLENSCGWWG